MKKVLISVGGTGGHVIPAKVLADSLHKAGFDTLFVGNGLSSNPYFDQSKYAYKDVIAPPLSLRKPLKSLKVWEGIKQSKRILQQYSPDAVIGFGSYHTVPTLLAAIVRQDPIVLYEANLLPGRTIRFFSSFAKVTTVHMQEASKYLKGHVLQVGYPLREEYSQEISKQEAFNYFGLDPKKLTFLVTGGSQGASGINQLLKESLIGMQKTLLPFQVIHLTGSLQTKDEFEILYKRFGIAAYVKEFEKNMNYAWKIATLCITRAGAGSIAEQLKMEVPGLLIPYPHSKDGHQEKNADHMMWTVGGGLKLLESKATPQILLNKIVKILEPENYSYMKHCMKIYKQNQEIEEITTIISTLTKAKK